jgi:SAM-dependent methyltransferase
VEVSGVPDQPGWVPESIDLGAASAARMYDYFLDGAHNFAVDRDLARKILRLVPDSALSAQANRAFLHRAVRYLVAQGVRQFVDIGSGIPTVGNVHEAAQRTDPDVRVLYVDRDPVAVAHSEQVLGANPNARVLQADLRRPKDILQAPELRDLIDPVEPVAVLMGAVLHFLSDNDRPQELIRQFHDALAPGSYLVISHGHSERLRQSGSRTVLTSDEQEVLNLYQQTSGPITLRSRLQIQHLFDGWRLVEPGLVWVPQWHPDWPDAIGPDPEASCVVGGVARRA